MTPNLGIPNGLVPWPSSLLTRFKTHFKAWDACSVAFCSDELAGWAALRSLPNDYTKFKISGTLLHIRQLENSIRLQLKLARLREGFIENYR